jgi:hypothetical protein
VGQTTAYGVLDALEHRSADRPSAFVAGATGSTL